MKQTYEEAMLKVAMFWSDKAKKPLNQNNGDDSPHGGLAFMLMNMNSMKAQETITDDKLKVFEKKLVEFIVRDRQRWLDVDYHPCKTLGDACEAAGINAGCLPCKTWTRINDDNTVTASYQYGGKPVTL